MLKFWLLFSHDIMVMMTKKIHPMGHLQMAFSFYLLTIPLVLL